MQVELPNIKKLFIPDPDHVIFDCDLKGADAQVVAWEAEDEDLKAAFRAGLDVHSKNAEDMWGAAFTRLQGVAHHKKRQECKKSVHGCNYGETPRTIAITLGWLVREAEQFQRRWFSLHPKIRDWQRGKQRQLDTNRTITNAFGYRRVFFDRPDEAYTEGLAWSPQSTVALVSFFGAIQLESTFMQPTPLNLDETQNPFCQMLLNNHDSIVFQIPRPHAHKYEAIRKGLAVTIPYPDPLTIPWGLKCSPLSWGDCKEPEIGNGAK